MSVLMIALPSSTVHTAKQRLVIEGYGDTDSFERPVSYADSLCLLDHIGADDKTSLAEPSFSCARYTSASL